MQQKKYYFFSNKGCNSKIEKSKAKDNKEDIATEKKAMMTIGKTSQKT